MAVWDMRDGCEVGPAPYRMGLDLLSALPQKAKTDPIGTGNPSREVVSLRSTPAGPGYVAEGRALPRAPGFTHELGGSLTEDRAACPPIEAIGDERYDGRSSGVLHRAC